MKITHTSVSPNILLSLLLLRTPNSIAAVLDGENLRAILATTGLAEAIHTALERIAFPAKQVVTVLSVASSCGSQ